MSQLKLCWSAENYGFNIVEKYYDNVFIFYKTNVSQRSIFF